MFQEPDLQVEVEIQECQRAYTNRDPRLTDSAGIKDKFKNVANLNEAGVTYHQIESQKRTATFGFPAYAKPRKITAPL